MRTRRQLARLFSLLCIVALLTSAGALLPAQAAAPDQQPTPVPLDPAQAAYAWLEAVAAGDGNAILKYTCLEQRERVGTALAAGTALTALAEDGHPPELDLSDAAFEVTDVSGSEAAVQAEGELRAAVGARAVAVPLDDVWQMVRERGTWRWCGSESGALPLGEESAGSGPVFETPEDAIMHYIEGVAANDLDLILEASAYKEMAAGFDFAATIERLNSYQPGFSMAPSEYPFYARVNEYWQAKNLLYQTRSLAYGLLSGEDLVTRPLYELEQATVEQMVQMLDPSRLAGLEILKIGTPMPDLMNEPRTLESLALNARTYGADEMIERVALIGFENSTFAMGFQLLRYGESWKVSAQNSVFSNLDSSGQVQPMTEAEFEGLIAGD